VDVYEANFARLASDAADTARIRARELVEEFLEEAAARGATEIPEARNPDFQLTLYAAQREYARSVTAISERRSCNYWLTACLHRARSCADCAERGH